MIFRCLGGDLHLFTNDNPETTLKGLGFKNKEKALESIALIEITFSKLRDEQILNTCSPLNLRPRYLLDSKEAIEKFYLQQKMYRVLGLLNRAKIIYNKYPKESLLEAISVLEEWMGEYRNAIQKYKKTKYNKCH